MSREPTFHIVIIIVIVIVVIIIIILLLLLLLLFLPHLTHYIVLEAFVRTNQPHSTALIIPPTNQPTTPTTPTPTNTNTNTKPPTRHPEITKDPLSLG